MNRPPRLFRPAEARRWEVGLRSDLRRRHALRWHGICIGSFMLALMWAASHLQMVFGVESLAVRYTVSLGIGYFAYLGVLRLWAQRMVASPGRASDSGLDALDPADGALDLASGVSRNADTAGFAAGGGGDFAGAGASADFGLPDGLGDVAGGALEAAASAEEGAVVAVPLVVVFVIACAVLLSAGALLGLYFGWEVLLTVAVELAFSFASARAAVRLEREGWLTAAVRLTWKPLLASVCFAVALGALVDHVVPAAHSLPQAIKALHHR
ncbi:MAG: hypothetical protein V4505_16715 [Pseudomonadota bacterium]